MHRRRWAACFFSMTMCLLPGGCLPKHIVWTPNGQTAVIWNDHGLFFCDAMGNISSNVCDNVVRAAWFPDGERLALEVSTHVTSWQEAGAKMPQKLRDDLQRYAQGLLEVKDETQWQTGLNELRETHDISDNEIRGVKMYIRDNAPDHFPGELLDAWQGQCDYDCYSLQIGVWKGRQFSRTKTLFSTGQRIWDFRFSRHNRTLVFTTGYAEDNIDDHVFSLWAADTETDQVVLLDNHVAAYPDWNTDGTSLFYVRSIGTGKTNHVIGTLLKSRLCDNRGALIKGDLEPPTALAGLVVSEFTKVRCLSNDRVMFSSMEVTLPVAGDELSEFTQLFLLEPKQPATIIRLIPGDVLPQTQGYLMNCFEVSPDETQVSFPDNSGRVAVVSMATGELTILQAADLGNPTTVPVWRYPRDLCYVDKSANGLLEKEAYTQVVLREITQEQGWSAPRSISRDWPKDAHKGWLEMKNTKDN